ncbi:unnamed protein product [Ectocarpus sp. 6 AP-2014]
MFSRALPRAANAAGGACAATSRRPLAASALSAVAGPPGGVSSSASAAARSAVTGRGRMVVASLSTAADVGKEELSLAARAGGQGAKLTGVWHPHAFAGRGQRGLCPLGGVRSLSTNAKEDEEDKAKEGGGAGGEAESNSEGEGEDEDQEGLAEKLAKTEEQLVDTKEKALYLAAEMENVRSIAKKDAESARLYAVQKFAKQLLDVADNLERAIASAKEAEGEGGGDSSHDVLLQGVEMTSNEASDTYLTKVFRSQGLEKYGEVKDKFDPHLHDAMFEFVDPAQEPGTLGQVLKCGYTLHGRVIRAAQVGTVKAA